MRIKLIKFDKNVDIQINSSNAKTKRHELTPKRYSPQSQHAPICPQCRLLGHTDDWTPAASVEDLAPDECTCYEVVLVKFSL